MRKKIISLIMSAVLAMLLLPQAVMLAEGEAQFSIFSEIQCTNVAEYDGINNTNGILGSSYGYGWARIDGVDFGTTGLNEFKVKVGVESAYAGKKLEFYVDSLSNEPFAALKVQSTGNWTKREWQTAELSNYEIYGVHSVYIVYYESGTGDVEAITATKIIDSLVTVPESLDGTGYEQKFSVLNSLGIIDWEIGDDFDVEAVVTAEAFVKAGLAMKGQVQNEEVKEMLTAVGLNGSEELSVASACCVLMRLLGRNQIIDSGSVDWYGQAADIGLKTSATGSETVNWFTAIDLLYKTLEIEPAVLERVEGDTNGNKAIFTVRKDSTLLSEYRNIYKSSGILTMDSVTGLDRVSDIGEGRVLIDNYIFDVGECDVTDMLGYNVDFYFKATGYENILLWISPNSKNETTTLYSNDIEDYSKRNLSYWDGQKLKNLKIPTDAKIIYNGLVASKYTDETFKIDSGSLEIISNNHDSVPDVVKIWSTKDYLLAGCTNNELYLKNADGKKIPTEDTANKKVVFHSVGSKKTVPESLPENTVITVAEAEAIDKSYTLYNVYTSKKLAEGTIKGKDVNKRILNIGGVEYAISGSFAKNNAPLLSIGNEIKAYLNFYSEIAFTNATSIENMLGYIVKAWVDEDSDKVMVRIFDEAGEMKIYPCSDNLYVNRVKPTDPLQEFNGTEKLVLFSANKAGELKTVNFAEAEATGNENNGLFYYFDVSNALYKSGSMTLGGKTNITADFMLFEIPENKADYPLYRVSQKAFTDDKSVTMRCYNKLKGRMDISIGVQTRTVGGGINLDSDTYYVTDIKEEFDVDEQQTRVLVTYYNGRGQKLVTKKMHPDYNSAASGLKVGDGIKIATDEDGQIVEIKKSLSPANSYAEHTQTSYFNNQNRYICGKVSKKQDSLVKLSDGNEIFNLNDAVVYVLEKGELTIGSTRDVLSAEVISGGSEIYMYMWYGKVRSLVVKK